VQEASVDVEDPQSPLVMHAAPSFPFTEEFYQFRAFSRDNVRVLLTLDTRSVDLTADGVNRTDGDFALAWVRNYGKGRVFYSAFGHFPESFTKDPVRTMLYQALLWLTGQIDLDATPRSGSSALPPAIGANGVQDLSGGGDAFAPGDIVTVSGDPLTSGSFFDDAGVAPLPVRLAGTHAEVNGISAPLFSVRPDRLMLQLPSSLAPGQPAALTVSSVNVAGPPVMLNIDAAAPSVIAAARSAGALAIYLTGLGVTDPPLREGLAAPAAMLVSSVVQPSVFLGGQPATVSFSGLAPGFVGLYQVDAELPGGVGSGFDIVVEAGGRRSQPFPFQQ
jgi:hypothetical protein